MREIISWLRNRGLAVKWFASLFAITAFLFYTLSYYNSRATESAFQKQFMTDTQQLNEKTSQLLDIYVDNMRTILLQLSSRSDLLQGGEKAVRELQQYRDSNGSIVETIYIVDLEGNVVSNQQLYYSIVGNDDLDDLTKLAMEKPNVLSWSEPYESKISGKTMAFVQTIPDSANSIAGTVIVEINLLNLTNRLTPILSGYNQTFTVISLGNNIVTVDADSKLLPHDGYSQTSADFLRQVVDLPVGSSVIKGAKKNLLIVKSISSRLGWQLVTFVDEDFFYRNLRVLNINYRNAALFWFIGLGIASLLLIRSWVSPLKLLVAKMDRVNDLEVLSKLHVDRGDEIGQLTHSYNRMMERIWLLVSKIKEIEASKKDYEFKMLQSQIGPHFLYNTLACISSLAKQQRLQEVEATVRSLTGLLSFSFDKRSEFVTLSDELEGLRMYAQIQSVRYGPRFSMHIEVGAELLAMQVIKLTIQPLVENAIIHGIFPLKKPGNIYVRAKILHGHLLIDVLDDGKGMSHEKVEHMLTDQKLRPFSKGFNSIGLLNVHNRIRIHCGNEYGLRIVSKPGRGTIVRISMPIIV
ncbi:sensor histidine kinase [Paenibacillus oryzisoli]|uniref:sensor histidine kinase n=1 Tax=Paenibacillus oryzisoli TaxID=1850517 RepID=UPI003D289A61